MEVQLELLVVQVQVVFMVHEEVLCMLNEGEVICDKCKGSGYSREYGLLRGLKCDKCQGKGKLDWVSNAMGSSDIEVCKVWGQKTLSLRNYNGAVALDVDKRCIWNQLPNRNKKISS